MEVRWEEVPQLVDWAIQRQKLFHDIRRNNENNGEPISIYPTKHDMNSAQSHYNPDEIP